MEQCREGEERLYESEHEEFEIVKALVNPPHKLEHRHGYTGCSTNV